MLAEGRRKRALPVALLAALVLASLALRLYGLAAQDIWWDEARNIDVASKPFLSIAGSPQLDIHPPVYFYLLHAWMSLAGHTPFAIRFLSLWFGVLLVALSYALGARVGGFWAGVGAAACAAALPFLVGEAQEARMYTVMCAWMEAAGLCLLALVRPGPAAAASRRRRGIALAKWAGLALFSALALLTHYGAVFALVALWGWAAGWALLAAGGARARRVRNVLAAGLGAGVLCLPGLPVALRQVSGYRNPNLAVPSVAGYLAELWRAYGLGEHLDPGPARPWELLLAGLVLGGLLLALLLPRRAARAGGTLPEAAGPARPRVSQGTPAAGRSGQAAALWLFALAWALVPLAVFYVVIEDRATFATRYISAALPGWLLLVGLAVAGWRKLGRAGGALAALVIVATLTPGVYGDLTDTRFFREDTSGLAAWLKANAGPDDLILADQVYPLGFYYERWGGNGDPPATPSQMAPARYMFTDINTVAEQLTTLAQGKRRIFWIRWFESDTDPRDATRFMLEKFGTFQGERLFRGYTVTWYEIPPGARFELAPEMPPMTVDFGNQVQLAAAAYGGRGPGPNPTAAETRVAVSPADGDVWAAVRWGRLPGAAHALKASLVLEDADGVSAGQDDRVIVNDHHVAPPYWSASDRPLGVFLIHPGPGTPPGIYNLKLAVYDPATLAQLSPSGPNARGAFVMLGQVQLTAAGSPPPAAQLPIASRPALDWRELRLLGAGSIPAEAGPGSEVAFDLYWQAQQAPASDYLLELSLRDPSGTARSAFSGSPVSGRYPTGRWRAGEVVRDHWRWRIDPATPNGDYQIELRWVDPATGQASPAARLGTLHVTGRPHTFAPPAEMAAAGVHASGAAIGDFARLAAFNVSTTTPAPGGDLEVTLFWQAEGTATRPYTVFVQLLDGSGKLRAQRDQQPGGGELATNGWLRGEFLSDRYAVSVPHDTPPGPYTLQVGMYDSATGARLPVAGADGRAAGDALPLLTVNVR